MPPDPGSCESPAPAAAPPPAALAMTSAGTASAAPRRLRRLGPTPGQLPHAWPPPRRLAPDRHARPQRDRQERRRARLRHRHPPSPVCQSNRKIPRDAPEAGGRFGRTAHPPAVTSPGTHHPKPGALGAGGTAASSDKSSRKKLKSRRVLPSLAATPRNEKIRSFLGSEKKRKKRDHFKTSQFCHDWQRDVTADCDAATVTASASSCHPVLARHWLLPGARR